MDEFSWDFWISAGSSKFPRYDGHVLDVPNLVTEDVTEMDGSQRWIPNSMCNDHLHKTPVRLKRWLFAPVTPGTSGCGFESRCTTSMKMDVG